MSNFKKAFGYAIKGLWFSLEERHMKIHFAIAVLVVAAGFFFHITSTEWLICFMLFAMVIGFEIVNTAIERLVDLVEPNRHPLAGKVKDLAAGAVLWVSMMAVVCGVFIFGKYVVALL